MLASLADAPLADPELVYEPKYDGIRAIVEIDSGGHASLWSRLGNEKTHQFPEIATALEAWARRRKAPRHEIVLDGEIVALDVKGEPTGFQQLQGRIHLAEPSAPSRPSRFSRPSGPSQPFPPLHAREPLRSLYRLRHSARGAHRLAQPPPARATVNPRARVSRGTGLRKQYPDSSRTSAAHQRDHARGRSRVVRARARQRLGRADCETGQLRVSIRQADAGLAEAQDRPRTGIRHRRLDRTAPYAHLLRGAVAGCIRERSPRRP